MLRSRTSFDISQARHPIFVGAQFIAPGGSPKRSGRRAGAINCAPTKTRSLFPAPSITDSRLLGKIAAIEHRQETAESRHDAAGYRPASRPDNGSTGSEFPSGASSYQSGSILSRKTDAHAKGTTLGSPPLHSDPFLFHHRQSRAGVEDRGRGHGCHPHDRRRRA